MREATGGVLLLQLVIVIISVFVFFIASVMQYTRVYRIKGTVINAIERGEGGVGSLQEFTDVLGRAGYSGPFELCKIDLGYDSTTNKHKGAYYSLEIKAAFTILPQFMSIGVPVRGTTRIIESGVFYEGEQGIFTDSRGTGVTISPRTVVSNGTQVCVSKK